MPEGLETLPVTPPPQGIGLIIALGIIVIASSLILRFYLSRSQNIKNTSRTIFFTFLAQSILFWGASFFITDAAKLIHTFFFKVIKTATILSGALYLNELINFYIWQQHFTNKKGESEIPSFLRSIAAILVYLLSIAAVIKFIFVKDEGALVTLTGGAALLLGYAAKEIIAHVFAALALNLTPSFHKGDIVKYDDKILHIEDINWRFVTFIDRKNHKYYVPNSHLTEQPILNLSNVDGKTKIELEIEVDTKSDPAKVIQLIKKHFMKNEFYNPEDAIEVLIQGMHNSIQFMIHFPAHHVRTQRTLYIIKTELYLSLWKIFKEHDIKLYDNIQFNNAISPES
jgi:small-conductance mechanosensitive channel